MNNPLCDKVSANFIGTVQEVKHIQFFWRQPVLRFASV
jgi:hypothetical protein